MRTMFFVLSLALVAACDEAGGTYTFGSQMPGKECLATLLPKGSGGEVTILLPGHDVPEIWDINVPTQVPGGTQVGLMPDSDMTIDGRLAPVACPPDFEEATCLEVLCPICRDPGGCPIYRDD